MCDVVLDAPSFAVGAWRRASKVHECCACDDPIRPGDRYHIETGRWGGSCGYMQRFKHCARCWAMFQFLARQAAYTGDLVQMDLDCGDIYENPPEDIAALAFLTADEGQALVAGLAAEEARWR